MLEKLRFFTHTYMVYGLWFMVNSKKLYIIMEEVKKSFFI